MRHEIDRMSEPRDSRAPPGSALVAIAICAPTALGLYPVRLALAGLGYGPAGWVAVCWQLTSLVTWTIVSGVLLGRLRPRAEANVATGRPALTWRHDGRALSPLFLIAIVLHALTVASASAVLMLGRGRPAFAALLLAVMLIYALMSAMTVAGLIGAAMVGAEHRARLVETTRRRNLERELGDARSRVLDALVELNGPGAMQRPAVNGELLDRITATSGHRSTVVPVDDIDWIEARSYYARLHVGPRHYLIRQSMNVLERRLDPKRFARIHRSTIVNLDRVVELQPYNRRSYVVVLRDGRRLMMSRRRRHLLGFLLP
jgi:DNA-binding LytR/AlgR family response regulator